MIIRNSNDKSSIFSTENQLDYYKSEFNKYKKLVSCPQCEKNQIDVALPCGHLLCNDCYKQQISSRARNCPFCRQKFSDKQILKVFLNKEDN